MRQSRRWLQSFGEAPSPRSPRLVPLRSERPFEWSGEALKALLARLKWPAPGLDVVPLVAWAAWGKAGTVLILAVARHLGEAAEVDVGALSESTIALLPKDEQGVNDGQQTES